MIELDKELMVDAVCGSSIFVMADLYYKGKCITYTTGGQFGYPSWYFKRSVVEGMGFDDLIDVYLKVKYVNTNPNLYDGRVDLDKIKNAEVS